MPEPSSGLVTILFTDLVGSTRLLRRMGDDLAEEVRRAHFSLVREAVAAKHGREVKNLGDGLMVVFPSALQAVGCAVAVQEAMRRHNLLEPDVPLLLRVGLHAGEPFREDDDYFGAPIVTAKRLCDAAKGGQILASKTVADLVGTRGGFGFRPVGRLKLKGLAEAVPAVTVQWGDGGAGGGEANREPRRRRESARSAPGRGPAVVGREEELAALEAELARCRARGFRAVLVSGEPGVGKTRLANELLSRHRDRVLGLHGRAHPLGATSSFGLWAEALEGHLRDLNPFEVSELCGGFLDDLAVVLRSVAAARGSVPEREPPRARLLEGLAVLLGELGRTRPVVAFLDDAHWADASSWEALQYFARNLPDSPLLVVIAARPAELGEQPLPVQVILGLEQDGALERLALGPLDAEGIAALARGVTTREPPAVLVEWLMARSGGNPLFALGLLRALLEEGGDLSAPLLRQLPEGLAGQVQARLRGLAPMAGSILELLGVLGRRVELGELAAVSDQPVDDVSETVDALVRSRLVAEHEQGATLDYEIGHPLIQEVIYRGITGTRRRRLHRRIGRALLAGGRLGEAALHFARSAAPGDDEAIGVLADALRQAEDRGSYREALAILASLVDLLPPGDERWLAVSETLARQADWVSDHRGDLRAVTAIRAMREIDRVLAASPDLLRRGVVKLRLASFLSFGVGEGEGARRAASEAVALFTEAGDDHLRLLAELELAMVKAMGGELASAVRVGLDTAERAEAAGDRFVAMQAYGRAVAWCSFLGGWFDRCEATARRAIAIAEADGWRYFQSLTLGLLGVNAALQGQIDKASARFEEARAVNPDWRDSMIPDWECILPWMGGDFAAAVERAREAVAWNPTGFSRRRAVGMTFATLSAVEVGAFTDASKFLALGYDTYRGGDDFFGNRAALGWAEAVLDSRRGREVQRTIRLPEMPPAGTAPVGGFFCSPFWLLDLAEMAGEAASVEAATEAAARLVKIALELDPPVYGALAALAGGWSDLAAGRQSSAAGAARRAVDLLSTTGCLALLGRAHYLLGRSLADRAGAIAALESAATLFATCGATWRRDRAVDALRAMPGRGRRVAGAVLGPGSLTSREREIVHLARLGLTATEMAKQLSISPRTAEAHMANAYAKLGVRSKVELVQRAAELGL
jgi:class 3 adenylate cyclase/DNA-binding CsgD family transcriptional regulator